MMKKILKIVGALLLLIIVALVSVPFLFKGKIQEKITQAINQNVNAQVSFEDVSLSLIKNFPNAAVSIQNLKVVNHAPFEGDTLFAAQRLSLTANLMNLLFKKDDEPFRLLGFSLEDGVANIHLNQKGEGNFNIAKSTENENDSTSEPSDFSLNIKQYKVENLRFVFQSDEAQMRIMLDSIYHSGKGDFSGNVLELSTQTQTKLFVTMQKNQLLKNTPISLDAVLGIDLNNQKYTFKDNKAYINKLALIFDGSLQLLDDGQLYDLSFKTPSSSFQNFLDLIPAQYAKNVNGVKTSGNFSVSGLVKGKFTEKTIPQLDFAVLSNNASFQYPDLPKAVENINIDVKLSNKTGRIDDTFLSINNLSFKIDQDYFSGKALVKNMVKNPEISSQIKATINLENLKQAYPIDADLNLKGIFKADVSTQLDMASVEKKKYENIQNAGSASLENFVYESPELAKPFQIQKAGLLFDTAHIKLSEFQAKTGETDLALSGELNNFYGFLFKNETLKGNFSLASTLLNVNDFLQPSTENQPQQTTQEEKSETPQSTAELKIPEFLDCTFNASAKTVKYDNLNLKNVSGKLVVKNQTVSIENLKTDIFGGQVALGAKVSTKEKNPTFSTELDMSKLNISETFSQVEMLQKIAPIAKAVQGLFNSVVNVSGELNPDMTPNLNSLSGTLTASLQEAKINENASPLISSLNSEFTKIDFSKLNLNDFKANLTFKDGAVNIKPFDIKWNDMDVQVSGTHGFDQNINYQLKLNLPPNKLGGEAEKLLSKLTATEQGKLANITVPVVVSGSFDKPKVSADLKTVIAELSQQIIKAQANKAIEKISGGVAEKASDILGNILGSDKKDNTQQTENQSDTSKKEEQKQQVKKAVGNILGGLLGGKKDTTTQKK